MVHEEEEEQQQQVATVESKMKNSEVGESNNTTNNKKLFLEKTFEIVENPETDAIVSWSETRDSFIVWDYKAFSEDILPNYFKHKNLSSFIRQLHLYGFRKVDSERYEFANEGFKGGKKHLLKNIETNKRHKITKLHQGSSNVMKPGLKDEVEQLKKDRDLMRVEIQKLRQHNENLHTELSNVQERIRCAELKHDQMLHFVTGMDKMQKLFEMLNQQIKEKEEHDAVGMVKRRRLLGTHCPLSIPEAIDTTPNVEHRHQGSEQLFSLQSEFTELLCEMVNTSKVVPQAPSPMEDELCSNIHDLRAIGSTESLHDASFEYDDILEKLLGESSAVDEEVHVHDSSIDLELEDFLSKSTDWTGSSSDIGGAN